ncbi:hypothetical protein D9O50_01495 [Oxalobacteraceae bacterium CAVE-383]|nr:hypothetical protein D9O50_01495 [Oxalobacteraceae bacterium CAVE-383]
MAFSTRANAAAPTSTSASAPGVCSPELTVDKEKLAAYMLRKYPVGTAYLSIGEHPAPLQSHRALLHWLLAKRAGTQTEGGSDAANVDRIAADMRNMLDGKNKQLTPSTSTDPLHFFDTPDGSDAVRCATADAMPDPSAAPAQGPALATALPAAPAAAPGASAPAPTPSWLDKIRVRGNPDQLSVDKSNTAGYASVDKAQIDFSNDAVANSRANDVQAYVGYSWIKSSFGSSGSTYEAIPYVGYKQNRVAVNNPDGTVITTTRTSDVGLLSNFHYVHPGSSDTEDLSVRPDYLMDAETGSRLLSANFTYTAFRKGGLNDLIPTRFGMSVKPILIGESRNGTYIDRGDASVANAHQDFVRLGAQAGFALVSNNPNIPVDFIATYTGLRAIVGSQGIHYVKAGLTYNFNQNIGLALNYSNGVLPESGDREKKWSLGVASKF